LDRSSGEQLVLFLDHLSDGLPSRGGKIVSFIFGIRRDEKDETESLVINVTDT
jgi:hypothetical protein